MRRLLVASLFVVLVPTRAVAGATITEVGTWEEKDQGSMQFRVTRGKEKDYLNGAGIGCFDDKAIRGYAFIGLDAADLRRLRALLDETITELEKK